MSRRGKFNKAFASPFNQQNEKKAGVPYTLLKGARSSGQLNLSGRSLEDVPLSVWRINVDIPEEAKSSTLGDSDERWWDQVDLHKLIAASNQLKEIPDEIKFLPALNVLDVHDNAIEKISAEIASLQELTKVHLSHNKLAALPDEFCKIVPLKVLFLAGNVLEKLPEDFGYLCKLEEIDLSDNKLTCLPESFGNLKQLKKLNLQNNQLLTLSNCLDNLTSLIDLNVSKNKITELPKGFGKLTSLEMLDLSYNQILHFTAFDEPAKVKTLSLGYNKIQKIDDDVFERLPYLVSLSLRDNAISVMPDSFTQLKLIERVDLSNNALSGLPYVIGQMDLKALTLDGNSMRSIRRDIIGRGTQAILAYLKSRIPEEDNNNVEESKPNTTVTGAKSNEKTDQVDNGSAPKNVEEKKPKVVELSQEVYDTYLISTTKILNHSGGNLPATFWLPGAKITKISLPRNNLVEYPPEISAYAATLSELDLTHNKLTTIPSAVGDLSKLTCLDLNNNTLTALPNEISKLEHLLQISLSVNQFTAIPKCLFACKQLQTILIGNNQIADIDVDGLLQLKTLHSLDLANNNIARIPPTLGNVRWLKCLTLDGNAFRQPRLQIMLKGTQYVLEYLRDRIPT